MKIALRLAILGVVVATADLSSTLVQAGCHHCGCQQTVRKACRLECGTKTVEEFKYGCECEDFCIPGRSTLCGVKCNCDGKRELIWKPSACAEVRTKRSLTKIKVTKEVPTYNWVAEEVCCDCHQTVSRTIRGLDGGKARRELVYLDTSSVEADQFADDDVIEGQDTFAPEAEAATYESVPKLSVRPVTRQRVPRELPVTVDAPHTAAARRVLR